MTKAAVLIWIAGMAVGCTTPTEIDEGVETETTSSAVERVTFELDETVQADIGCGFDVYYRFAGSVTGTTREARDGTVRYYETGPAISASFFAPSTGNSVNGRIAGIYRETSYPDGTLVLDMFGTDGAYTVKGEGVLFTTAGYASVTIHPDGTESVAWHTNPKGDPSSLCAALD